MKVKTKSTAKAVAEMTGDVEVGLIAEMVSDPAKLASFGFGKDIVAKALALKEGNEDEKPEFPVVRVEEGWSNSGRLWTSNELDRIAEQTNALEPVGHLGHIPDDQAAFAFPEPQTTWLGAIAKTEASKQKERLGEMVKVLYFAGYNLPGAKVRGYIKSRAVRGVSWWGDGELVKIPGKGVEVRHFTLKALDWARKLSEGMPSSRIVAIASEMEGKVDGKELSQVTPDEFKKENPNGYALLRAEVENESTEKIGEMEAKVTEGDKAKSLLAKACEAIGVSDPDKLIEELTALKEKVGAKAAAMVKTALDSLLEEKVPNEERRALVKRLLPVGEMETKAADAKDEDDVKKIVSEMTDKAFNDDEVIQQYVGEQQPPIVRRREQLRGGGENSDQALAAYGLNRERVTLGS